MKNKRMLLLSIVLAAAAGIAVFGYLSELERKSELEANLAPVLVAKTDIPARSRLNEGMFAVVQQPKEFIHPQALTELPQVKGAFASERLAAGEQVLASRLVAAGELGAGLAYLISLGHRAMSVPVDSVSGVGGFILPGDRVDVLVTIDVEENDANIVTTTLVAENLLVLAVGTTIRTTEQEQLAVENVTLQVPANRVAALTQAGDRGALRLTLRAVGEKAATTVRHHTPREFLP
jgi:pilus assembly protein CpaB